MLVLDNCEHVLSSARQLVQDLLRNVEDLRIITTSRHRLGLPAEVLLDVGPLVLSTTNAADSAPMRLFMDRVERSSSGLAVSEQDLAAAADICRLVDGLPLALELAAARVSLFGFDGLRQRLVDGLTLPSSRVGDDSRRHATIESTVEWSLALLSPQARDLFNDLSVFPSWFDLTSLEEVLENQHLINAFSEILDSSLAVINHDRQAYRLLEPVRHVAARHMDQRRRDMIVMRYLTRVASIVGDSDEAGVNSDLGESDQTMISYCTHVRRRRRSPHQLVRQTARCVRGQE